MIVCLFDGFLRNNINRSIDPLLQMNYPSQSSTPQAPVVFDPTTSSSPSLSLSSSYDENTSLTTTTMPPETPAVHMSNKRAFTMTAFNTNKQSSALQHDSPPPTSLSKRARRSTSSSTSSSAVSQKPASTRQLRKSSTTTTTTTTTSSFNKSRPQSINAKKRSSPIKKQQNDQNAQSSSAKARSKKAKASSVDSTASESSSSGVQRHFFKKPVVCRGRKGGRRPVNDDSVSLSAFVCCWGNEHQTTVGVPEDCSGGEEPLCPVGISPQARALPPNWIWSQLPTHHRIFQKRKKKKRVTLNHLFFLLSSFDIINKVDRRRLILKRERERERDRKKQSTIPTPMVLNLISFQKQKIKKKIAL